MVDDLVIVKQKKEKYSDDKDIEKLIEYVAGHGKNEEKENAICGACGLSWNYKLAKKQLISLQYLTGKITERRMYHWIVSFRTDIDSVEKVLTCSKRIGDYFYYEVGHSCFWGVHQSTENLHIHFAMNAINRHDAKKWHTSNADFEAIKKDIIVICNEILEKNNKGRF